MQLERVPRGLFVTTSSYTKEAQYAARAANISPIDGTYLVDLAHAICR